jgi:hypothetical protein
VHFRTSNRVLTNSMVPGAFVDFLQNFKSSTTDAADQLEGLNLNGDGDSDEYDMVEDSDDPAPDGTRNRSKQKYMQMLQEVADRTRSEVTVDLNDVEAVGSPVRATWVHALTSSSTRRRLQTTSMTSSSSTRSSAMRTITSKSSPGPWTRSYLHPPESQSRD